MHGYAGQILRVDLSNRSTQTIDTMQYAQWVGGHGMGSAIFFDLVKNKAISGYDPANVVTLMTSPLSGTLAPGASSRCEVQGIGIQSYPIEWFTRSNFGGRFAAMLKYAGWDGVVIEGRADAPVWVDVRNRRVTIRDAGDLWGLDTWQTQERIWQAVVGADAAGKWIEFSSSSHKTTQRPAVVAIGPAGENLSRTACLIHDAGCASGQGGFGGVWGAKNLKALSVIGSDSVNVADPDALMSARVWAQREFALNVDKVTPAFSRFAPSKPQVIYWQQQKQARLTACIGCHVGCKERNASGQGNGSACFATAFYARFDRARHGGKQTQAAFAATDLLQKLGINACEALRGLQYIVALNKLGLFGPGKKISCDLDFSGLGKTEFVESFLNKIAYRQDIGDDFAEGFFRASNRWGRRMEDQRSGLLYYSYWGLPEHGYDPRAQIEWGYGSILGDRDINEHEFNKLFLWPSLKEWGIIPSVPDAEWITRTISAKLVPFENDPRMLDYNTPNIYSKHMAKLVAWHRRYARFWKQSALYCDFRWPEFFNTRNEDSQGLIGEGEPKFLEAVTGNKLSFADGMEIGRKTWNLDNAIWTLQGRHRDMVHFPEYIYQVPYTRYGAKGKFAHYYLPGREGGRWSYIRADGRHLDKTRFDEWKTIYYKLEGWDPDTGWPRKNTLASLGLGHVNDELASQASSISQL